MPFKFQFLDEIIEKEHSTNLEFNSPSLGILSQRFVGPGKYQILDLGAPVQSNVAFFSDSSCRLYVEDLYRFFIAPQEGRKIKDDEDDDVASAIADALDYAHQSLDLEYALNSRRTVVQSRVSLLLSKIYDKMDNRQKAYEYLTLHDDSIEEE